MSAIAVLIPVLGRPANAAKVVRSLKNSTSEARAVFICTYGDDEQIAACESTGEQVIVADWQPGFGEWARKINLAYRFCTEPWLLLGADDLHFHPGWFGAAHMRWAETGALVIGTNDLGNPSVKRGMHSTHPLVRRDYVEQHGTIDEPRKILHEGYFHNWVDVEFVETAMSRGQWAFARRSHVEHLHPHWGKGRMDATYARGLEQRQFEADRRLLQERRPLWLPQVKERQRALGRGARMARRR